MEHPVKFIALTWFLFPWTLLSGLSPAAETVPLNGTWRFAIDDAKEGVSKQWFKTRLPGTIRLPGTTEENGKGPANQQRTTDSWTHLYQTPGTAWYQRNVKIPASWAGKRITLVLERTKRTRLWVDDRPIGQQDGICTAQVYDLGTALTPGDHVLTIQLSTGPFPKGIGGHHLGGMQGNWNGIVGRIELTASDPIWIDRVLVTPNVGAKQARVRVTIGNATGKPCAGRLTLGASAWNTDAQQTPPPQVVPFSATQRETLVQTDYPLGPGALLWDEFSPALYKLTVSLATNRRPACCDRREIDFGLREFRRQGTQFTVNGKTVLLRGTHNACSFPLTAYPSMDVKQWERLLRIAKSYGINHYRFHTWTPPEAALAAADVVGIYLQPELPSHAGFRFGEDRQHDDYCRAEGERILTTWGNHPSLVMLALGNEIGIPRPENRQAMTELVSHFRKLDPTRLYAEGSNNEFGRPTVNPGDDYFTTFRTGPRQGPVRGSFATVDAPLGHVQAGPPSTLADFRGSIAAIGVPVIGHETGQYTIYPDFAEMAKYTGVTRLANYEIFRDRLQSQGMLDQAHDFFRASGALAVLCYREEIEEALRTPGFGGFQLLDIMDYQGQGTALVGILDAFMDDKHLIRPDEWRQFCCETVPLVRMAKYTWTTGETFTARAEVAHYGPADIRGAVPQWSLVGAGGQTLASGELPPVDIPQGNLCALGPIAFPLHAVKSPQRLTLELRLKATPFLNRYPIWVYPETIDTSPPASVAVRRRWDEPTRRLLAEGGTVVLLPKAGSLENCVGGGFATDFWCWPMFKNTPGTMGLLCDPSHPALAGFPSEFHSDWQWFYLATNARPVILDQTPADYRPVVQVIDNFARNHKLGLIFEARSGRGKLLVCAGDLLAMQDRPEARQLLASLLGYAASPRFQPTRELPAATLDTILAAVPPDLALGKPASASSSQGDANAPGKANDGDLDSRWCAADNKTGHWWQVDLQQPADLTGCEITWELNRRLYRYLVEGSADGHSWTPLADRRDNQQREQVHRLRFSATGIRYVRITVTGLEPERPQWASIREVRVFGR